MPGMTKSWSPSRRTIRMPAIAVTAVFALAPVLVNSMPPGEDAGASHSTTPRVAASSFCADATDDGQVTASDALAALRTAVGDHDCPLCRCDVNGDGKITATDALAILFAAVSNPGEPPDGCPEPCADPADPCVGALSCDRRTVGEDELVTGSTETGYRTVIDGPEGLATIEWTVDGASTNFRYRPPNGIFGPLVTVEGIPADAAGAGNAAMLLHRNRPAAPAAGIYTGPNTLSNTSGCDQLHQFDCGPIGKCCDVHDNCINEFCGGQGECGNVLGALEAAYGPSACSPSCLQCHGAVVKCFFDGSHPGPSNCCNDGDCERPQQCMIDGRVITDPCHCRDQGIASMTPCPETCLTDCQLNFDGCLPDGTVSSSPSCCCSCRIRIGTTRVCSCQEDCCPNFPECAPAGGHVFHYSGCCSCEVIGPGVGGTCK